MKEVSLATGPYLSPIVIGTGEEKMGIIANHEPLKYSSRNGF
jgi:hypothetical protein